jgi:anti-anti-sigma regulatory factor
MTDIGSSANRVFLVAYGQVTDRHNVQVSMAGELGSGDAGLLGSCRARILAMPVTGICLDLSALRRTDEAGARSLVALCRVLRLDGLQVDVRGVRSAVKAVLLGLGLTLEKGQQPSHADAGG